LTLIERVCGVTGTVKKLVADRGFGFIRAEGQKDIFFHASIVKNSEFDALQEGDEVEYECEPSERGPKAVWVSLLEG